MNSPPSPFVVVFYEREMEGGQREREREKKKNGWSGSQRQFKISLNVCPDDMF